MGRKFGGQRVCAPCNNTRSQPFDRAHDRFEDFVVANVDVIGRWRHLDWSEVFGADWERDAGDLARYFGEQLGCMFESYRFRLTSSPSWMERLSAPASSSASFATGVRSMPTSSCARIVRTMGSQHSSVCSTPRGTRPMDERPAWTADITSANCGSSSPGAKGDLPRVVPGARRGIASDQWWIP